MGRATGLFSRFIFYYMNILPVWKNVFATNTHHTLDDYFRELGYHFYDYYKTLQKQPETLFTLTEKQQDQFNTYFSQAQDQYLYLCGTDYIATVRRLALITFRIAMILTTLRIMETPETTNFHISNPTSHISNQNSQFSILNSQLKCSDTDFQTALTMVQVLIQHAAKVFETLPVQEMQKNQPNQKQLFLEALPSEFSRKDYIAIAATLNIQDKAAEKYIAQFTQKALITHFAHDKYKKATA